MSRQIDTSEPITPEEAEYLRQRGRLTDDIEVEGADEDYQSMSVTALRKELKKRDLDYSKAKKDELVARLETADEEGSEATSEDDEDDDEE